MNPASAITLSNSELTHIFFALALLIVSAHTLGYLFQHFKMPKVVGEIIGGLILGPTFLGYFFPKAYEWLFNAFLSEGKLLSLIYWIGLLLLMFISGFEIEKTIKKEDKRLILYILFGSTLIPFFVGWIAPSIYDFSSYLGPNGTTLILSIIIAIAVAITSIPVISRIFIDLKIMDTRFSKVVLSTATLHDVILFVALAVATSLAGGKAISQGHIAADISITLLFFALALFVMPKLVKKINKLRSNLLIKSSVSGYILFISFSFAALASILNVNFVFGAFLAGIVIGMISDEKMASAKWHIKEIGFALFIPVYFSIVGLKLDLVHHFNFLFFLGFLAFTTFFQMLGTVIAAKMTRLNWLSSFNLGVAMSARGGPGIILATVAFDLGLINETFFSTLVLIAIVTSLFAGFWFRYVTEKKIVLLNE